ncbi:MAG TPA: hypothetical protein VMS64_21230 [Candidatus Methylomirabilis sp.]|nr:hypothetical protein [Candidatus Methylomirabilis sp.]
MPDPEEKPHPLDLEARGEAGSRDRRPVVGESAQSYPLLLERWAIVARRIRAGYEGYVENDDYRKVQSHLERGERPRRRSLWGAMKDRMGWGQRDEHGPASEQR